MPAGVWLSSLAGRGDAIERAESYAKARKRVAPTFRKTASAADPETFPVTDRWQGMADDPDTMRARLDRTIQLIRRASGAEY